MKYLITIGVFASLSYLSCNKQDNALKKIEVVEYTPRLDIPTTSNVRYVVIEDSKFYHGRAKYQLINKSIEKDALKALPLWKRKKINKLISKRENMLANRDTQRASSEKELQEQKVKFTELEKQIKSELAKRMAPVASPKDMVGLLNEMQTDSPVFLEKDLAVLEHMLRTRTAENSKNLQKLKNEDTYKLLYRTFRILSRVYQSRISLEGMVIPDPDFVQDAFNPS